MSLNSEDLPGYVTVSRLSQAFAIIRGLEIHIDGKLVGEISSGSAKRFMLAPGMHTAYCKMDWCTSPSIKFEVAPGQEERLRCGTTITGAKLLIAIYFILFRANDSLFIEPY